MIIRADTFTIKDHPSNFKSLQIILGGVQKQLDGLAAIPAGGTMIAQGNFDGSQAAGNGVYRQSRGVQPTLVILTTTTYQVKFTKPLNTPNYNVQVSAGKKDGSGVASGKGYALQADSFKILVSVASQDDITFSVTY